MCIYDVEQMRSSVFLLPHHPPNTSPTRRLSSPIEYNEAPHRSPNKTTLGKEVEDDDDDGDDLYERKKKMVMIMIIMVMIIVMMMMIMTITMTI